MTDLKDFIRTALVDICKGVHESTAEIEEMGGIVNPRSWRLDGDVENVTKRKVVNVHFDVLVEAQSGEGNTGRVGVLVATIGMGTKREATQTDRNASSVQFDVPLVLPVSPEKIRDEAQAEQDVRDRTTAAIRNQGRNY